MHTPSLDIFPFWVRLEPNSLLALPNCASSSELPRNIYSIASTSHPKILCSGLSLTTRTNSCLDASNLWWSLLPFDHLDDEVEERSRLIILYCLGKTLITWLIRPAASHWNSLVNECGSSWRNQISLSSASTSLQLPETRPLVAIAVPFALTTTFSR